MARYPSDGHSHGDQQSIPEEKHAAPVRSVHWGFVKVADDTIVLIRIQVLRASKNGLQDWVILGVY